MLIIRGDDVEREEYPLYIDGKRRGSVSCCREGLYTQFDARAETIDAPVAVWLHGNGKSACLGRLIPNGKTALLTRKLSRSEIANFPEKIEYATNWEEKPKRDMIEKEPATQWTEHRDGTLTKSEGEALLVAIPCELRRRCGGIRIIEINGKEYLLFRY